MPNRNQSRNSKLRHHIRLFFLHNAFHDRIWAERICINTYVEAWEHIITLKNRNGESLFSWVQPAHVKNATDAELAVVLTDSRGRGAFQK